MELKRSIQNILSEITVTTETDGLPSLNQLVMEDSNKTVQEADNRLMNQT